jgi:hypothetical protein
VNESIRQILIDWARAADATYTADLFGDGVDAFVSAADHHFVDHDLLGAENDTIGADYTDRGAVSSQGAQKLVTLDAKGSPCLPLLTKNV